jgi:ornithine cyclodeaminase/alanine dehydrogenase-like protein (mu-crystallin family)
VPLYLNESDIDALLDAEAANGAVEECEQRMARGAVDVLPRARLQLEGGAMTLMAAVDRELGLACSKNYVAGRGRAFRPFVVLHDERTGELAAIIEARRLGQLRTGAASAVAARQLARTGARTLGVIGCGYHAIGQVECIRAAFPSIARVRAFCRTEERLRSFCEQTGAVPARDHRQTAEAEIVVTITSSPDPVPTSPLTASSTTRCSSGPRSSVATSGPRRRSSPAI